MTTPQIEKILTENSPKKLLLYLRTTATDSLARIPQSDPLEQLNPAVHSLGYLKARLEKMKEENVERLVEKIAIFLREFDASQIRLAPTEFQGVASEFARLCDEPILSLAPLKTAIHRYSKSPSHLTSIHYLFIQQCLLSQSYDSALGILDITIDDLDLETELTYQYYLLYFYYGVMVYIALKQFEQASDFCSICISAPGSSCSAIQLEAYKKYILISLILYGKMFGIPSTVSQACVRAFKHLARPYEDFARSLKKIETAQEAFQTHEQVFRGDMNMGLVIQVMDRMEMRRIINLKETYITISVEDVVRKIGLRKPKEIVSQEDIARVEGLIVRMIDGGTLTATLSSNPPIITFHNRPPAIPTRAHLEQILSSISTLNTKIKTLDKEVALSKPYILKFAKQGPRGLSPEAEGEDEMLGRFGLRRGGGGRGGRGGRGEKVGRGGKAGKGGPGAGPGPGAGGSKFPNFPYEEKMED